MYTRVWVWVHMSLGVQNPEQSAEPPGGVVSGVPDVVPATATGNWIQDLCNITTCS